MKNSFKQTALCLLLLLIFSMSNFILAQEENEGDAVMQRNAWFYIQRAHPYDTIPSYGYADAIAQKNQLIHTNGFSLNGLCQEYS
jgi:hypothetical protein